MIPDYDYNEFKRKLCTNSKWMRRGLSVLAHCPKIATPTEIEEIMSWIKAIEKFQTMGGTGLPLGHGRVVDLLGKYAPDIYRFYREQFKVPEATS